MYQIFWLAIVNCLEMLFEITLLSETFITEVALKGSSSVMFSEVVAYVAGLVENFPTKTLKIKLVFFGFWVV